MSQPLATPTQSIKRPPADLDTIVEAFEDALAQDPQADLAAYLPDSEDPSYTPIAVELIRVDLERTRTHGTAKRLEEYRGLAPKLFRDSTALGLIAYEEYRLRKLAGEPVDVQEYSRRFAVDTASWPTWDSSSSNGIPSQSAFFGQAEQSIVDGRRIPTVGDRFAGFELVEQLGRGAFGVVFRARQIDLSAREVVLKLSALRSVEPQRLARLQHTNIVPIYSVHSDGGWLGICMPYLGRSTLAGVLRVGARPGDEQGRISTVAGRDAETVRPFAPTPANPADDVFAAPLPTTALDIAASPSIETAIDWIARLAEGLAHAHRRGIVHSDLKPANVLLGDDGTPLLLDFNLSDDVSAAPRATLIVGGTLPYMAPEHLRATLDGSSIRPESDIFSLGVIFFELLTQQRPFPARDGSSDDSLAAMIADRARPASVRSFNRAVSPSIAAVVARCLAPEVKDRYRSAAELAEDLRCHQRDLPLPYTREPSLPERCRKWFRRNSRGVRVAAAVGLLVILGGVSAWAIVHQERLRQLEATTAFASFQDDVLTANLNLHAPGSEPELHAIGRAAAKSALGRFDVEGTESQTAHAQLGRLSAAQQTEVRQESLKLRYALADSREAKERLRSPSEVAPETASFLQGIQLLEDRQYAAAIPVWEQLGKANPRDPVRWLLLGNAFRGAGRLADAEACYTAVIALQPQAMSGYLYRGMCRNNQGRFDPSRFSEAEQDFSAVLELRPALPCGLMNRALAWQAMRAFPQAERDATAAIDAGLRDPRAFFVRANIRQARGNVAGAKADREQGFSLEPIDELGWMARGMARLVDDPHRAREDFEAGLNKYPESAELMENLVHVYADRLHQPAAALAFADRRVAENPQNPSALASRAVIHARLGHRAEAHADAEQVAALRVPPLTSLQLACVYAITFTEANPADVATALRHLQTALARDPRLMTRAAVDPDLEPIRSNPEFASLMAAAGRLIGGPQLPPAEADKAAPPKPNNNN